VRTNLDIHYVGTFLSREDVVIPLFGSTHHICVYVPCQDVYFQHHMSCFYVFSEIIKEVIVRFVDSCEIDDLSLYKLSFL
jgi:hypothetical protein